MLCYNGRAQQRAPIETDAISASRGCTQHARGRRLCRGHRRRRTSVSSILHGLADTTNESTQLNASRRAGRATRQRRSEWFGNMVPAHGRRCARRHSEAEPRQGDSSERMTSPIDFIDLRRTVMTSRPRGRRQSRSRAKGAGRRASRPVTGKEQSSRFEAVAVSVHSARYAMLIAVYWGACEGRNCGSGFSDQHKRGVGQKRRDHRKSDRTQFTDQDGPLGT